MKVLRISVEVHSFLSAIFWKEKKERGGKGEREEKKKKGKEGERGKRRNKGSIRVLHFEGELFFFVPHLEQGEGRSQRTRRNKRGR